MKGTVHIVNPEREETVPQNQIPLQANQINITNNPVGNNTYIERYPQMKFVQDPKYRIHANFRPEVTEITTKLAEAVREAVWDCQRNSTYTQEAFESNMEKHLESVPKVTVVSYGVIQKIDQFGNPWADWMDSEESYELLQQSLLKIPLKQGTANVQYVPLETEEETEEQEEEKPWWERAWDSIKETASDVWDTVTSKEFREKALAIGGILSGATIAVVGVMDAAGAAGPAMGAVVTYLGGSVTMAGAATTATTVGGWIIVGALVVDAVNTLVEVATGENLIVKGAYELFGNENWTEEDFLNLYWEGKDLLYMGAYAYTEFGANGTAGYSSQESEGDSVTNIIPDNNSTIGHIFREAEGHIPDTLENRALLVNVANNTENFRGIDKYGNEWYTKILENGKEVWVESRNGKIFDGGVNEIPKSWNSDTGLKK